MGLESEQFMSDILDAIYLNDTIDAAAGQVLEQTSCFLQADAAYLTELSEGGRPTGEYMNICSPESVPQPKGWRE